ncbi:hypothetical protein CIHG_05570 [Coccidioides immitis H538.4]|uniref:Uncharacterized protein n=1 Tax=Coccidioides immitis H538.4 TaxID=396776 RepID=A0A0J8RRF3_COCIT|nr:hypothetical protein CIHG_05570 [Coccidioides immitis H538.4]
MTTNRPGLQLAHSLHNPATQLLSSPLLEIKCGSRFDLEMWKWMRRQTFKLICVSTHERLDMFFHSNQFERSANIPLMLRGANCENPSVRDGLFELGRQNRGFLNRNNNKDDVMLRRRIMMTKRTMRETTQYGGLVFRGSPRGRGFRWSKSPKSGSKIKSKEDGQMSVGIPSN